MGVSSLVVKAEYVSGAQASSTNYSIHSSSINAGGTDFSTSSSYSLHDTVGEMATGRSSSTNYQIRAGYRQLDESTISISTESDITLPALGGVTGGASIATSTWTVITDSPGGYELSVAASTSPALQSAEGSFADYDAGVDPDFSFGIAASESGFGFTPEGVDILSSYLDDGSTCSTGSQDTSAACWSGFATSSQNVAKSTSRTSPSGADTTLRLRAEIGVDKVQSSGTYQATITVTAISL